MLLRSKVLIFSCVLFSGKTLTWWRSAPRCWEEGFLKWRRTTDESSIFVVFCNVQYASCCPWVSNLRSAFWTCKQTWIDSYSGFSQSRKASWSSPASTNRLLLCNVTLCVWMSGKCLFLFNGVSYMLSERRPFTHTGRARACAATMRPEEKQYCE